MVLSQTTNETVWPTLRPRHETLEARTSKAETPSVRIPLVSLHVDAYGVWHNLQQTT